MTDPTPSIAAALVGYAATRPDQPAVIDDDGVLTYGELDALAGTLALALRERIPEPGPVPVPLVIGQDRWGAVALHAVFRAGLTVAPLDPDLPPAVTRALWERLGRPGVVVTGTPGGAGALTGVVDELVVPRRAGGTGPAPRPVDPDAPVAIVFTSGSTGRPKGVVIGAAALDSARRQDVRHVYDPATARVAMTARVHWVGGIRHMANLAAGITQVVTRRMLTDPGTLVEWWDAVGATQVSAVPSLAVALAGRGLTGRRIESVTRVGLGGEPLTWDHVAIFRSLVADEARILNTYGASETGGVAACEHWIEPGDEGAGPVPLGRPTPELTVRTEPVADAAGDLHQMLVAGPIFSGYLDDPALDAEQCMTDAAGVRWWRSGDLVRVDATGLLWAAGRVDDVVKINGVLVAPLQAEEVLRGLAGITDVAVVPVETPRGNRLVAHVVVADGAGLTPDGVRAHCTAQLAPQVVPHVLVRHDRLPTLGTGKVDRAALRTDPAPRWRTTPPRGSRSSLENWLLATVRDVTGTEDLAPDDDLLLSGLDSLGIVDLCAAIEEAGLGRFEPDRLLALRTVAGLAAALGPGAPIDASAVCTLNAGGARPPVFVIPPGGGTAIGYRHLATALGPDRPLAVVEARCLHARSRIPRTVERFAADATADIAGLVAPGDAVTLAGFSAGGPVAYETARRLAADGHPVHLVLLDTCPTFAGLRPGAAVPGVAPAPEPPRHGVRRLVPPPLRGVRGRWRQRRHAWFGRRPRFDVERYRAVLAVMVRAGVRYRPAAATFPVTLLYVADSPFVERSAAWIDGLDARLVPGRHDTMLMPPHVAAVADTLGDVADRAVTASAR